MIVVHKSDEAVERFIERSEQNDSQIISKRSGSSLLEAHGILSIVLC
jgi:hypothetical protein